MKKLMNRAEDFVDEALDGIVRAHPGDLRLLSTRVVVRQEPAAGQVGIVTGGGFGHLPLFLGYVGPGLCTAAAVGNVFSSPSPHHAFEAAKAADTGAGVLFLYGNYGGDVMTFDLAVEECTAHGISTRTVLGRDDISSAPKERAIDRRGVAGLVFGYKCAGAAAARGYDLDRVTAATQATLDNTATVGFALSPTILPSTGRATFTIGDSEMELGTGMHGERGSRRTALLTADALVDELFPLLVGDLGLVDSDEVDVLVNGLGGTPREELYILFRRLSQLAEESGISIRTARVGEYVTSLEMAGGSLSVVRLRPDFSELLTGTSQTALVTV
jgi:dihydroxyacetone kinase/dihydroxyacetone kinase-like protein